MGLTFPDHGVGTGAYKPASMRVRMSELTAQIVERGRHAPRERPAGRRQLAHDMRTVRERLTSTVGLERSFEQELVRLFAEYHSGSAILLLFLASATAFTGAFWLPVSLAAGWLVLAATVIGVQLALSQRFLAEKAERVSLVVWRRRFTALGLIAGLLWAMPVHAFAQAGQNAGPIAVFLVVMIAAMTASLSATVPHAVHLGLAPLGAVVLAVTATTRDFTAILFLAMAATAILFFLVLARRLYASAVATIQSRAEKDAIFAELEEAKANSDEARRRAEEANLAKSRFLATMSHELRTPLNAILGFSEVMKNEVFGAHATPSYRDYSADIHGSGQHLLTLINEILDLSRIEAGRYELNEEAMVLAHTVSECRHMLNLRAKAKNQTVREQLDPSLPRIWADERAVRQIVLNVLSNAVKFTPPGGEITVKVGWTSSGGQYVSVKDTGHGIPEEEIPVVMSSFGRGSLAIKTAEQGSGLGLPIVKGLVDLHGGGFQLRSTPREGTEVIVTFPTSRVMDALPAMAVARA